MAGGSGATNETLHLTCKTKQGVTPRDVSAFQAKSGLLCRVKDQSFMESVSSNHVHQGNNAQSVESVVKHFNFAARSQVKLLEEKNLDLQRQIEQSRDFFATANTERDDSVQACALLEKKCRKLTSTVAAHETEISYLKKELKHLQADKENRKHFESRRMKEMQSIKGKASRRNTVSSSVSSDVISSTTLDSLFESSLSPLPQSESSGMRKRVLSFSSGLNVDSSSSELQRLRVENNQYLARVRQLEEKISYLKQGLSAKEPEFADLSFGSDESRDTQTSVIQTCLEEAIDGNLQLREENVCLLSQLQALQSVVETEKTDKSLQVSSDDIGTDLPSMPEQSDLDTGVSRETPAQPKNDFVADLNLRKKPDDIGTDLPSMPEQSDLDTGVSRETPAQPKNDFVADLNLRKKPEVMNGSSKLQDNRKSRDVQDICDLLAKCVSIGRDKPATPHRAVDTDVPMHTLPVGQDVLSTLEELDELS